MNVAEDMPDAIQLQIGEPADNTPEHIQEAAIKAMKEGYTHYTANAGFLSFREAIARRMRRDYDLEIPTNRIIVTAGAVAALNISLLSLVEIGEEVLLPDPTYPNYNSLIRLQGATPVYYPTKADNSFLPDIEDIEKLITPYTKVMIVNSPSNPTGAVFTEEKWVEILQFAEKHDLYIISDELYDKIIFEGKHISPLSVTPRAHERVISIYGFSKVYAMTGWRLAYAIVPEHLYSLMCKLQEPITTCASSISQKAGEAALDGPQDFVYEWREKYREKRDLACGILENYNMDFIKPKGAFYIYIDISASKMAAKQFALTLLKSEKVVVAPCGAFGPTGDQFIRVCFAGDVGQLHEGLNRLGQFYQKQIQFNNKV